VLPLLTVSAVPHRASPCLLKGGPRTCCWAKGEPHDTLAQQYLALPQWKQLWFACSWFQSYGQQPQPSDWKVLVPSETPVAACRQLRCFSGSCRVWHIPPECTSLLFREPLPGKWEAELDAFQKLLVLRCLRGDKITNAMQDFVALKLDRRFIEPQVTCQKEALVGPGVDQEASSLL